VPAGREAAGGGAEFVEGAVVAEEPGGGGLFVCERHLRCEPLYYLFLREAVAGCESSSLQGRGAGDDEESVEAAMGATFDQQRGGVDNERGAVGKGGGDGLLAGGRDAWMEDGVEPSARLRVCEDEGAERGAVEFAGGQKQVGAEGRNDLLEAVAAGRNDGAGELIGIDDGGAALGQKTLNGALAAGDASRKSDESR
jgi:hypothetical protein